MPLPGEVLLDEAELGKALEPEKLSLCLIKMLTTNTGSFCGTTHRPQSLDKTEKTFPNVEAAHYTFVLVCILLPWLQLYHSFCQCTIVDKGRRFSLGSLTTLGKKTACKSRLSLFRIRTRAPKTSWCATGHFRSKQQCLVCVAELEIIRIPWEYPLLSHGICHSLARLYKCNSQKGLLYQG